LSNVGTDTRLDGLFNAAKERWENIIMPDVADFSSEWQGGRDTIGTAIFFRPAIEALYYT
jgi:hypothetical protein